MVRTGLLPHPAPVYPASSGSQKSPTSRDIPRVTLTNIPHVETSAFDQYLSQVGRLFEALQSVKLERESSKIQRPYQTDSVGEDDERPPPGGRKTSTRKPGHLAPAPLSTVPSVYFNESLRLENPRTFDVVSEHAKIISQPLSTAGDSAKHPGVNFTNGEPQPSKKTLTTSAILQEKLLWYIDTVEVHLLSSISQASTSFSAALGTLRELQAEAAGSVAEIQKLRGYLVLVDKEIAVGGSEIIDLERKRDNLRHLSEATEQLQYVLAGTSHCKELIESGQLETALQRIPYVEQLRSGTLDLRAMSQLDWLLPNPPISLIDLRQLHALERLSQGLSHLRLQIGKGYEARLIDVLLGDLRRHVADVPSTVTLLHWKDAAKRARGTAYTSSSMPADTTNLKTLREALTTALHGLVQSQHLAIASTAFREAVIREMKSLIRQHLPSSTDDDDESVVSASTRADGRASMAQQKKASVLSRNLRALSPQDATAFFAKVYYGICEALQRLGVQVKLLLDITSEIKKASTNTLTPVKSPGSTDDSEIRSAGHAVELHTQEEVSEALDMSSLLGQAVDKAQSEMIKVLRVRTEQTVHLDFADFLSYFALNRLFVFACETVSGNPGTSLKDVINGHLHDFIPNLHEFEKQKLAQSMESEKWERVDFKTDDESILARFIQSVTSDPPAWLDYMSSNATGMDAVGQDEQANDASAEPSSNAKQAQKDSTVAVIEEGKFMLVRSTTFALRGLERYTILIASAPGMAREISTVLLDYLKLYNSRTQQLILGAGAKVTAELTNINTKHLALASQSISFFTALIPYLRECLRRRPNITGLDMAEYDQLKRLFQDHQSSIHDKLVDIMSFRTTVGTRAMEQIKWDDETEVQRNVSPHMVTLTKETLTLQRVLSKYLPVLTASMIFGRILFSYQEQWSKAFEGAVIWTEAGKARLLRDAELFKAKLGDVDGMQVLGALLINIVEAKQVVEVTSTSMSVSPPDKGMPT